MSTVRVADGRAVLELDPDDVARLLPEFVRLHLARRARHGADDPALVELVSRAREALATAQLVGMFASEHLAPSSGAGRVEWLTVNETARVTGVTAQTVRRWAAGGRFPGAQRLGGGRSWVIPLADVLATTKE